MRVADLRGAQTGPADVAGFGKPVRVVRFWVDDPAGLVGGLGSEVVPDQALYRMHIGGDVRVLIGCGTIDWNTLKP